MLRHIKRDSMGHSNSHWLDSFHHFSFADYYNPNNIQFGVLRVVNDDLVGAGTGFNKHFHENMEIISYVVEGELTHTDNMGNRRKLTRGQVQYMSAGTGVKHGEHNYGHEVLRFLQIWILPNKEGYTPNYGDLHLKWEDRVNRWMPIASGDGDKKFPIQVHADVHIYSSLILRDDTLDFKVNPGRQAYLIAVEGEMDVNGIVLGERDALEIVEEDISIYAGNTSHLLIIEMEKP
ncbi:pirin family protein [Anaerosphaera multitolerans]|uniref:Pirin family protein n=1 Tax=Anaerosphaera multitolerans TaxID=2487351 RepID=A0A437S5D7_9FIRM|nr:pirin-like bicupin family protein [Anaerosphaera multitolerans]RVU54208.1 pirin family protein [Anaerosphaera multitolerans]